LKPSESERSKCPDSALSLTKAPKKKRRLTVRLTRETKESLEAEARRFKAVHPRQMTLDAARDGVRPAGG
jgi:hypothetical protein